VSVQELITYLLASTGSAYEGRGGKAEEFSLHPFLEDYSVPTLFCAKDESFRRGQSSDMVVSTDKKTAKHKRL